MSSFLGKSKTGVKYKGTIEVPNLSDENDMEDLAVSVPLAGLCRELMEIFSEVCLLWVQISVMMNKDEPDTPLLNLMKRDGAEKVRQALGSYVDFLKTGQELHVFSHSFILSAVI